MGQCFHLRSTFSIKSMHTAGFRSARCTLISSRTRQAIITIKRVDRFSNITFGASHTDIRRWFQRDIITHFSLRLPLLISSGHLSGRQHVISFIQALRLRFLMMALKLTDINAQFIFAQGAATGIKRHYLLLMRLRRRNSGILFIGVRGFRARRDEGDAHYLRSRAEPHRS